ncbi:hypothetical protein NDU88_001916 [Pleurodeles waltl]|uniref:Uncharacterized protein n=1 Tax=Pleurodeles waltl TaxID=8319 RepID=A0AAV7U9A1_PLEWA|nr:hypothetical protein NDU88_001916 [Pleurodeles waltl]
MGAERENERVECQCRLVGRGGNRVPPSVSVPDIAAETRAVFCWLAPPLTSEGVVLRGLRQIGPRGAVHSCVRLSRTRCNVLAGHVGPRSVGPARPEAWGRVLPLFGPASAREGGGWC